MRNIKGFTIGAPNSRSGKTTLTLGIVKAFRNRGIEVQGAKTGPDFVDTAYLSYAAGVLAANFDSHMMGASGICQAASSSAEILVVEGVMGYFDGISNSFEGSSYDIARILNIPSIICYSPSGESLTAIIKLKGMIDFSKGRIKGAVFNRVSEKYYKNLKAMLETHTDVKAYGYLPADENISLSEEKLGLSILSDENMDNFIDEVAKAVERTVDLDGILKIASEVKAEPFPSFKKSGKKIAVAYDDAFRFLYRDNLRILEVLGDVKKFSPLKDKEVPLSDFLYLPGGLQMSFRKELSENREMLRAIREFSDQGGMIFSEGGGFEYLCKRMGDAKMTGIFPFEIVQTERLNRFGYHQLIFMKDTYLGRKGLSYPSKEYHKTKITGLVEGVAEVYKNGEAVGTDGFVCKNTFGMENHLHFLHNPMLWEKILTE